MTYHNQRQSNGRFAPKTSGTPAKPKAKSMRTKVKQPMHVPAQTSTSGKTMTSFTKGFAPGAVMPTPPPAVETKLVNNVMFVLDGSGSMGHLVQKVKEMYRTQVSTIKDMADTMKQESHIANIIFENYIKSQQAFQYFQTASIEIDYQASGGTALAAAFNAAVNCLKAQELAILARNTSTVKYDVANLLIVITDGEENGSTPNDKSLMRSHIAELVKTENWTIAFNCPPGGPRYLQDLGVPSGNINCWEGTAIGVQTMSTTNVAATANYMSSRRMGVRGSTTYYQVDMSAIDAQSLAKLPDERHQFESLKVERESDIKDFVNAQLTTKPTLAAKLGHSYVTGRAYYELTKDEVVQPQKDVVIVNKVNGNTYSGMTAKRIIGLSLIDSVKVSILNLSHYTVYVQSTSTNRKLVRGSSVLYRKL